MTNHKLALSTASILVLASGWACKQESPLWCDSHDDCAEWGLDFCDVNGEYPASGGIAPTCIENPFDAGAMGEETDASEEADAAGADAAPAMRCPDGMAFVPAGTYVMNWKPGVVTVPSFCMDVGPVTVAAYDACEACSEAETGGTCNAGIPDRAQDPINCVDAAQADFYCAAHGKGLPSEEQWEWAARGGEAANLYAWGSEEPTGNPQRACWRGGRDEAPFPERPSGTCPVGQFKQAALHPFGLEDISGNVEEWSSTNGLEKPTDRVVRGGGWSWTFPSFLETTSRHLVAETTKDRDIGFRCVSGPLNR